MALRTIVQDGDSILNKVCRPVTNFDEKLAQLLEDMKDTLDEAGGLGLAGPQVGVMRRLFICLDESDLDDLAEDEEVPEDYEPKYLEFINPEILEQEGEVTCFEGCLSFPGHNGEITRPQRVKVRAFDRNGKPFEYEGFDMMARCICHENNHLDGITIMQLATKFYEDDELEEE